MKYSISCLLNTLPALFFSILATIAAIVNTYGTFFDDTYPVERTAAVAFVSILGLAWCKSFENYTGECEASHD